MAHLYLTMKWMQNQQPEALLGRSASNSISAPYLRRLSSNRSGSLVNSNNMDYDDVEDLEMLLEAYFMQLDGTRNKILSFCGCTCSWNNLEALETSCGFPVGTNFAIIGKEGQGDVALPGLGGDMGGLDGEKQENS
ncbi:hypothetical protein TB2_019778 [Malus domestica]|uniref:Uncharacterized protein n=1 Tax=Malus domestica TaxID=3750 RepID=A0A498HU93_MALDO|nr:hypothetical protein DVH24_016364 [Malus domestica]